MRFFLALLTLCLLAAPNVLVAGTQDLAVIAVHVQAHASKASDICGPLNPNNQGLGCASYTTEWPTHSGADVYIVVAGADPGPGIAGVSCGIAADPNVGIFGWKLCADLEFPNSGWPASGAGNRITWTPLTNCQVTSPAGLSVHAVAGALYVYAYGDGQLILTPNDGINPPEYKVADCASSESELQYSENFPPSIGFGGVGGWNPCGCPFIGKPGVASVPGCSPVQVTTWGNIKAGYR